MLHTLKNKFWTLLCLVALIGMTACVEENEEKPAEETGISIAGTWDNNFGGVEVISNDTWDMGYIVQAVELYDNEERFAVTKNPDDAEYDPGKFNMIVWLPLVDDSFYYCTVDFGKETLDDALNTTNEVDTTNPDEAGCGGFGWSKLTRQ